MARGSKNNEINGEHGNFRSQIDERVREYLGNDSVETLPSSSISPPKTDLESYTRREHQESEVFAENTNKAKIRTDVSGQAGDTAQCR